MLWRAVNGIAPDADDVVHAVALACKRMRHRRGQGVLPAVDDDGGFVVAGKRRCAAVAADFRFALAVRHAQRLEIATHGLVAAWETTAVSAACKRAGKVLPRFSARRSIPAHAVALKQYRGGIDASSTCDKDDTAAALGHAEILGGGHPPRDCARTSMHTTSVRPSLPWRDERAIFAGKRSQKAAGGVVVGIKDAGNIFPNKDGWRFSGRLAFSINGLQYIDEFKGEVAARIRQALAPPGKRKCLAWRAANQHIRRIDLSGRNACGERGHIAEIKYLRPPMRQHRRGKRLDLGKPCRLPAEWLPGK